MEQKRKSSNSKWDEEYIITVYELAREGMTEQQMAKFLGISKDTFINWEKRYRLFRLSVKRGREYQRATGVSMEDFRDDIYRNLSDDEKLTWQRVMELNTLRSDRKKVAALFKNGGRQMRQKMYLCALLKCRFNAAAACRMTGLSREVVELWKKTDPGFWKMVSSIEQTEKDWAQSCVRGMCETNPVVAMYYNRVLNRDRGMDDRITVNVQGTINHEHTHRLVAFDDLELDARTELSLLNALRQKRKLIESKEVTPAESVA